MNRMEGYWIPREDNGTPMHECSNCGSRVVKGLYEYENPNLFCYHCGAKMKPHAEQLTLPNFWRDCT